MTIWKLQVLSWRRAMLILSGWALLVSTSAECQTLTVLYSFSGADGAQPQARLIQDGAGNLYGTTFAGGAANLGTVFKLDTSGKLTVLHSFNTSDGTYPSAPLLLAKDGNLYGTTFGGGSLGYGTVFKLDALGNYTVLHNFLYTQGGGDGSGPHGGLIQDPSGNLYGTTGGGGTYGIGTIFKIDTGGNESVFFNFTDYSGGFADVGGGPWAGLVQDQDGNFYGTNLYGGLLGAKPGEPCYQQALNSRGCGTVFRLDSTGALTGVVPFGPLGPGPGHILGSKPYGEVVVDAAGKVFGTAAYSGDAGFGTIFQMNFGDGWKAYSFAGPPQDGAYPHAGLVEDGAGNLFGTTQYGTTVSGTGCFNGSLEGCGTVFKFDPSSGTETVEYSFNPSDKLAFPAAGLLMDSSGALYGTTEFGGASGMGGIFKLVLPDVVLVSDFSLPAFSLSPSSITAGSSATSTIDIAAVASFSGTVTFTCYVQPSPAHAPQCSINPSSTNPGSPATLTVTTTGASASLPAKAGNGLFYALGIPLLGLAFVGTGLGSKDKRWKARASTLMLICTLTSGLAMQLACGGNSANGGGGGGGGGGGTPSGNYQITVTGVSGSLQHSVTSTLTVQ